MDKCECGNEKDEKYLWCMDCNKKNKASKKKDPIVDQLEKINNNLYKVTVQLGLILEENFDMKVVWEKKQKNKKGHFIIEDLKLKRPRGVD